jgi:hypothetical protein
MAIHIAARDASLAIYIGLICLSVFLQILGAPISFWMLEGSADDLISTLLMGLTFHATTSHYIPLFSSLKIPIPSTVSYNFLDEHVHFRPPLVTS